MNRFFGDVCIGSSVRGVSDLGHLESLEMNREREELRTERDKVRRVTEPVARTSSLSATLRKRTG